jgi:hypothetical protein
MRPSGNSSPPSIAAGNTFWHSGINNRLNLTPFSHKINKLEFSRAPLQELLDVNHKADTIKKCLKTIPPQVQAKMSPTAFESFLSVHQASLIQAF